MRNLKGDWTQLLRGVLNTVFNKNHSKIVDVDFSGIDYIKIRHLSMVPVNIESSVVILLPLIVLLEVLCLQCNFT